MDQLPPVDASCPNCGAPLESQISHGSIVTSCTRCDWSVATTKPHIHSPDEVTDVYFYPVDEELAPLQIALLLEITRLSEDDLRGRARRGGHLLRGPYAEAVALVRGIDEAGIACMYSRVENDEPPADRLLP